MNPQQMSCFCVWYKQGLTSAGRRSFTKTAEITGVPVQKVWHWSKAYGWKELAREKDEEINREIEQKLMSQVVEGFHTAVKRQRLFAGRVWEKIFAEIGKLEIDPEWILKFMQYELGLYEEGRKASEGAGPNFKVIVENHISKEARSEILSAFGDAAERRFIDG